jgi:lysophospholipase L1-like esterase
MTLLYIGLSSEPCLAEACQSVNVPNDRRVALYRVSRHVQTGQLHVLAVGTAFTLGDAEWREEQSYPAFLEDKLRRRLPQVDVQVLNGGRDGATIWEMLSVIQEYIDAKTPSVVVWQVGPADAIQDSGVEIFQEALHQGIAAVQAAGADVVLIDLPYGPEPYRYKALREYQNAIVATAREMNVGLISVYSRMARHFSGTKVRTPHECTADLVANYVMQSLRYEQRNR